MNGARVGLDGRSRPVGGQLEDRRVTGQLLTPVCPEALALDAREHPGLPVGVVDEAFRGRRRRCRAVLGGVEQAQLVENDVDGPEVDGDVMQSQQEHVFLGCALQQRQPQHRAGVQVERTVGFPADPLVELGFSGAEAVPGDPHRPVRMNELDRLAVALAIGGPQHRMPVDQRLGGAFQRRHVEFAADTPGIRDGVGGAGRCEFMDEPHGPLAVRHRMHRSRLLRLLHEQLGQQCPLSLGRQAGDVDRLIRHRYRPSRQALARPRFRPLVPQGPSGAVRPRPRRKAPAPG